VGVTRTDSPCRGNHGPPYLSLVALVVLSLAVAPAAQAAVAPPWDTFFASQATVADFGANQRAFGVAAGDFDSDGKLDLVSGRVLGHLLLQGQRRRGPFQAPSQYPWKQTTFNAWSLAAGDLNEDGKLDLVWGANSDASGTSLPGAPGTP
jgi:FG-GAP repeat